MEFKSNEHVDEVLKHLNTEFNRAKNDQSRADILVSMGQLHEESLQQNDQALFKYKRALDFTEKHPQALVGISRILWTQKRFHEAEEVLKKLINCTEERLKKAEFELQLASLYLKQLDRTEDGKDALVRALDLDPLNRSVYPLLHEIYQESKDWQGAIENLMAWLDITQDKALALKIMNQMADLWETHFKDADRAQSILEEVLLMDQEDTEAIQRLESIYRTKKDWQSLIILLERQVGMAFFKSKEDQIRLRLDLAELYTTVTIDYLQAESHLERVLQLESNNTRAKEILIRIHEARANWVEVARVYREDLKVVQDPKLRVTKLLRLAEVSEDHLGKPIEASQFLEKAFLELGEIDPHRAKTDIKLIQERDRLYSRLMKRWRQEGDLARLQELFQRIAEYHEQFLFKLEAFVELTKSHQGEKQYHYARELLAFIILMKQNISEKEISKCFAYLFSVLGDLVKEVFSILPSSVDIEALEENRIVQQEIVEEILEDLSQVAYKKIGHYLLKSEQWTDLIRVFQEQLELTSETSEKSLLWFRIGEIQGHKLGNLQAAEQSYQRSLREGSHFTPAIRARRDILLKLKQYKEALSLFQLEIPLVNDHKVRSILYYKIGCLREEHLGQVDLAIRDFEHALSLDSNNFEALKRLAVHYYQSENWTNAEPLFEKISIVLEETGERNPLKFAVFWTKRAKIALALDKFDESEAYLKRALDYNPTFVPALEQLGDLCMRSHRWKEAKKYYETYLKHAKENNESFIERILPSFESVNLNLAHIEERLGHHERAKDYYEKILSTDATHVIALEAMVNIESQQENWHEVQKLYDRVLRQTENPDDWITIQFAKGEIWETHLDKPKNAIACYLEVLKKDPLNTNALEKMAKLYCATGVLDKGVELLERLLNATTDSQSKVQYLHSLAKVHHQGLKDLETAYHYYLEVLKLKEDHLPSLKLLNTVLIEKKSWRELVDNYEKIISIVAETDRLLAIPFYLKMGEVYDKHLGDPDQSIKSYKSVIDIDKDNVGARNALVRLYSNHEGYQEEAINQHRTLLEGDLLRVDSLRALANIHLKRKELDKTYCFFKVLDTLGVAMDEERNFVLKCESGQKLNLRTSLTRTLHRDFLVHPGEHGQISEVMRLFSPVFRDLFMDLDLVKEAHEATGRFAQSLSEYLRDLTKVLELPMPIIKIHKKLESRILIFGGETPVFVSGHGFFRGSFGNLQKYQVAKTMESLVNGRELIYQLNYKQLKRLMFVMMKAFFKEVNLGDHAEKDLKSDAKKFLKVIPRKSRPAGKAVIGELMRQWKHVDIKSWLHAVELTSQRAGLLFSGNFTTALNEAMLKEGLGNVDESVKSKKGLGLNRLGMISKHVNKSPLIQDLISFACSEDYFRLRKRIGLSIAASTIIY